MVGKELEGALVESELDGEAHRQTPYDGTVIMPSIRRVQIMTRKEFQVQLENIDWKLHDIIIISSITFQLKFSSINVNTKFFIIFNDKLNFICLFFLMFSFALSLYIVYMPDRVHTVAKQFSAKIIRKIGRGGDGLYYVAGEVECKHLYMCAELKPLPNKAQTITLVACNLLINDIWKDLEVTEPHNGDCIT
uniref:Uncharacterized protein n=1 Tax=Glossina austeni TaxID=7395 RepID=A0A1A9UP47_GLOAU